MSTINPKLTTRDALQSWLLAFHDSTEALDAAATVDKFFVPEIEVQYANNPVVKGRDTALGFFDSAFKALDYMHHDIEYFDFVAPDRLYQAATIKYVVKGDDREKDMITIPGIMSTILVEDAEGKLKIKRNEIFLDASRVFARMAEKGLISTE